MPKDTVAKSPQHTTQHLNIKVNNFLQYTDSDFIMNPGYLYIFFENHNRDGPINSFFAKRVIKHAKKIQKRHKVDCSPVNHLGCLFYHQNQLMIVELDYFCGGKIAKQLDRNSNDFQIFEVCKISVEQELKILKICDDKLIERGAFYSFRRYNFKECKKYCDFGPQKIQLSIACILQSVVNFFIFTNKDKNGGYNCVKLTFEILDHCNPGYFKKPRSPYELLIESDRNAKK